MSTADILQSPQKMTSAQLRKIKKPIIEKRRRERINESLNQLKTLVFEALNKDEQQYNKMEKADILEMTVKHLRCLQRQVSQAQKTADTPTSNYSQSIRYKSGYGECAEEVRRYLGSTNTVPNNVKHELSNHLNNRISAYPETSHELRSPPSPASSPLSVHSSSSRESLSSVSPVSENIQPNMCSNPNMAFPVNGSQAMLITGQVSPVLAGHSFVPIVISPVTSQQAVTSQPMVPQQSSPLAGTVIPLYHTSPNSTATKNIGHNTSPVCANNKNVKSALQFTDRVHNLQDQSPANKCNSSFSMPKMVNYSPEPVWRPW